MKFIKLTDYAIAKGKTNIQEFLKEEEGNIHKYNIPKKIEEKYTIDGKLIIEIVEYKYNIPKKYNKFLTNEIVEQEFTYSKIIRLTEKAMFPTGVNQMLTNVAYFAGREKKNGIDPKLLFLNYNIINMLCTDERYYEIFEDRHEPLYYIEKGIVSTILGIVLESITGESSKSFMGYSECFRPSIIIPRGKDRDALSPIYIYENSSLCILAKKEEYRTKKDMIYESRNDENSLPGIDLSVGLYARIRERKEIEYFYIEDPAFVMENAVEKMFNNFSIGSKNLIEEVKEKYKDRLYEAIKDVLLLRYEEVKVDPTYRLSDVKEEWYISVLGETKVKLNKIKYFKEIELLKEYDKEGKIKEYAELAYKIFIDNLE